MKYTVIMIVLNILKSKNIHSVHTNVELQGKKKFLIPGKVSKLLSVVLL
jgi:hypothetical protein